jgi:hypothetical protein
MAYLFGKEILLAFTAWVVFVQVRSWLRWRALKKWGAEQGCKDAPALPNKLPGGIERYGLVIDFLLGRLKSMNFFFSLSFWNWRLEIELRLIDTDFDFLEDSVRKRTLNMGVETFRINNAFNETMVITSDPENVQALLATKFHDFDLGPQRRQMFEELLGHGIFVAEGEAWAHYRKSQFLGELRVPVVVGIVPQMHIPDICYPLSKHTKRCTDSK